MFAGEAFVRKMIEPAADGQRRTLAYGCLYMDTGEGSWEFAETQINSCIQKVAFKKLRKRFDLIILGFDIIATKEQIRGGAPNAIADRLLAYVDEKYPTLHARAIGITHLDEPRPVRNLVLNFSDQQMKQLDDYVNSSEFDGACFFIKE